MIKYLKIDFIILIIINYIFIIYMEYIKKYKKYREKYKKLLSKLNGGYFLGDKSHESFFLPRIERNLSLSNTPRL